MPAAYPIDAERRLVISRAWGTLITAEVAAHYRAIAADPRFDPAFRQMADLTAVERIAMRAASVRREAVETVFDTRAQRAFVVANAEQESAALLYGRFGRYVGQNVRVFREIEDAERWLGLAPTRRGVHDGQSAEPRA